jgi:predicted transcriptional regulator
MSETDLLRLSAQIVSAHAKRNKVPAEQLVSLIQTVHGALQRAGEMVENEAAQIPAVPIKRSVFPKYIVCLEDGKKRKMLTRHLQATYGMTPDEYRAKWKLPPSYPMIAPDYAVQRVELANRVWSARKARYGAQVQEVGKGVHGVRVPEGTASVVEMAAAGDD